MTNSYSYEDRRFCFLTVGENIELKVSARVKGWADPGRQNPPDLAYAPEGEEETEVEEVLLLAYGHAFDMTVDWEKGLCPELLVDVEEALKKL